MSDLVIAGNSPFDSIRRQDERGEYWSARELMPVLGYAQWRQFSDTVDKARAALKANGHPYYDHIADARKLVETGSKATREIVDYRLSRLGAYMTAMNGDPRKPEIAAAQTYFAIKTREAETIIPAMSERLQELQAEIELQRLRNQDPTAIALLSGMHGTEVAMMLIGKSDAIVETEKPTIEVIDPNSNRKFAGQTLKQVADYLSKRTGRRFKSGADIKRALDSAGRSNLIEITPRRVDAEYIPMQNLPEVYEIIGALDRQRLIGE
jgi:hypothetical protein